MSGLLHKLHRNFHAFAGRHAGTVSIPDHQPTGDIAVGDEQQAFGQFVLLGRHDTHFDGLTFFASQSNSIAVGQTKASHISRGDLQGSNFLLVFVLKLALTDAAALIRGPTGNKYKGFSHAKYFSKRRINQDSISKQLHLIRTSLTEFVDLRQRRDHCSALQLATRPLPLNCLSKGVCHAYAVCTKKSMLMKQ